jgi:hypothetical protein
MGTNISREIEVIQRGQPAIRSDSKNRPAAISAAADASPASPRRPIENVVATPNHAPNGIALNGHATAFRTKGMERGQGSIRSDLENCPAAMGSALCCCPIEITVGPPN